MTKILRPDFDTIVATEADQAPVDTGIVDMHGRNILRDHVGHFVVEPAELQAEQVGSLLIAPSLVQEAQKTYLTFHADEPAFGQQKHTSVLRRIAPYAAAAGVVLALGAGLSSADASLMVAVDNSNPSLNPGYSTTVISTLTDNGLPVFNDSMSITKYAKETYLGNPFGIDAQDILSPAGVSVNVSTPTDLFGHATVTIDAAVNADPGLYHYVLQGDGDPFAKLTGDFTVVPEPCTLGLLAAGAGMLALTRRRFERKGSLYLPTEEKVN